MCFDAVYLDQTIIRSLQLRPDKVRSQVQSARNEFNHYCQRFSINKKSFLTIKGSVVVLVDDGIATGSTVEAARLFLKSVGVKKIILASPVAPADFNNPNFNAVITLYRDPYLSAISQYYQDFRQLEDEDVNKILNPKS